MSRGLLERGWDGRRGRGGGGGVVARARDPERYWILGFITGSRGGGCAGYDRALPSPRKSSTDASDLARDARIT